MDIEEDNVLRKKAWKIDPQQKLDVFGTSAKKVTFYTDIDKFTVHIGRGKKQDFIIMLNGKDSAMTRIQYEPSRLHILKGAAKYNFSDNRPVPTFTYQSAEHTDLKRIRAELKLDSIAGKGDELTKIFNLMYWVHNLIQHDGNSTNPTIKNAIDLIKVCQEEKRGINCRMLAVILNECYLAMGIKSRYITCMPKELEFQDYHVINMVYSQDLDKWIWIDPTFAAYVMDENGTLLGIQEVRERLINGKSLILNADANWNREAQQTKDGYLKTYMAKNLYRLETPVESKYNAETWNMVKEIEYVELLPLDALEQTPQRTEEVNNKTGVKFVYYKTNNPNLFWTKSQ